MHCPLCAADSRVAFEAKGFPVHDCKGCGHRFAGIAADGDHTAAIYDDSYFTGGGAGYSDYLAEGAMLRGRGRDYARIVAPYVTAGTMLDVGAAAGFLLQGFADGGWRGTGVEPNPSMVNYGREHLKLDLVRGDFETYTGPGGFDLISMVQVVAHFHDPRRAFANAFERLRPGGVLLIETWNSRSLMARALGKHWHEYSPPSVLHWFSPVTLTAVLTGLGFEKAAQGRPSKKISGEHAKSLLKYRLGARFDPLLRLIPDRVNFPYPAEDLFWALYRKPEEPQTQGRPVSR